MEERVYFTQDDIFEEISKVLLKNGLQETVDDFIIQDEEEKSLIVTTLDLTENLALKRISEKDFILELEKQLNTTPQVAAQLAKDIKEKILPGAEKITAGEQPPEERPATTLPVRPIASRQSPDGNDAFQPPVPPLAETKKPLPSRSPLPPVKPAGVTPPPPKQPRKADSYREPLE